MQRRPHARARVGLALATLFCVLVGGYGLALAASGFGFLAEDIAANGLLLALEVHIVTASAALVLVPWQLWPALRARAPRLHRWTGRGYVVAATVGGVSGVAAAVGTTHGPVAAAGFGVLGLLWTWTTVAAYRAARRRDLTDHRRWAIRSFALAFAAVTLRLYLPISGLLGLPFEAAYPVVAWLCWIPNLWLAERALRRSDPSGGPLRRAIPREEPRQPHRPGADPSGAARRFAAWWPAGENSSDDPELTGTSRIEGALRDGTVVDLDDVS